MTKIERNDPLVNMMLGRIPKEHHNRILAAVDAGISRQLLKLIEKGIHNNKPSEILDQIQACDISTESGFQRAVSLAD